MKATELIKELQNKIDEKQKDFEVLVDGTYECHKINTIEIKRNEYSNEDNIIIYPDN